MSNIVYFWKPGEENGFMSNWFPVILETFSDINGVDRFYNTEGYMMYQKAILFGDYEIANTILTTRDPKTLKKLGRQVSGFVQGIWNQHKFNIMVDGLTYKFKNPMLRRMLLATGDQMLVEASPKDKIWGIGLSAKEASNIPMEEWPGENLLGKALMEVRCRIRSYP